jgi:dynactin complex subunit
MFKVKPGKQVSFVASCLLAAAMLGICATRANATTADVDQLFQDARTQAGLLARDTDTMESFTHSDLSWEAHADEVRMIKSHINKLGEMVSQLQAVRDDTDKRHQEAIDRILPSLQELASNTTAIIDHLNHNQSDLQDPSYQEYLKANVGLANNIFQVVSDTVTYDNTKDKIERLQEKLARR